MSAFGDGNLMVPFSGCVSTASTFYPLIPSAPEEGKAELTMEAHSGFELETPGLGIQCLSH